MAKDKNRAARRRVMRDWIETFKNKPCMDCGNSFPAVCMDFDHRPGEVKKFDLASAVDFARPVILEEIAKCDVVCACCHRLRTISRTPMISTDCSFVPHYVNSDSVVFVRCGHARTPENSRLDKNGRIKECRICARLRERQRRAN